MNSHTTHPLVYAYLRDLELLLQGVDPSERAEVLAGVREHLDGSLPERATDEDVRQALAGLGSPQVVADEAYADGRQPSGSTTTSARVPVAARPWVPVVVGVLLGLSLIVTLMVVSSMSGYSTSATSGSVQVSAAGEEIGQPDVRVDYNGLGIVGAFIGLLSSVGFWAPALVAAFLSPLWSRREKVALASLAPVAALMLVGLPALGFALTRAEIGINIGAWLGLGLSTVGGGWLLLRLCRLASARAA